MTGRWASRHASSPRRMGWRHAAGLPVCVVLVLGGCGPRCVDPLCAPEPPIVWPAAPDEPRVRYLGSLTGSEDFGRSGGSWRAFREALEGPQPTCSMVTPHAVSVDPSGMRVAVADTNGGCVHVFDLGRRRYQQYTEWAGGKKRLQCPVGIAWVQDALWVSDAKLPGIVVFSGTQPGQRLSDTSLQRPGGLVYCPDAAWCMVADTGRSVVCAFDTSGSRVACLGGFGAAPGCFNHPVQLAARGRVLAVADALNFRVQLLGYDGESVAVFGRKGDAAGDFALPKGVAFDQTGNVWVSDAQFENIQAFDRSGRLLLAFGQEGQGPGEFWLPSGLCIDNQDRLWVADTYNRRVQVFQLLP